MKTTILLMSAFFWMANVYCQDLGLSMIDANGNTYRVVRIGNQTWMAENLRTTLFDDQKPIQEVQFQGDIMDVDGGWATLTTGAYAWYDNNKESGETFGALYNWYAASSEKICPQGWRVPTELDWQGLIRYLGGGEAAGGKMKTRGTIEGGDGQWFYPNVNATNESGFGALPSGHRSSSGHFYGLGHNAVFWSATEAEDNQAYYFSIGGVTGEINRYADYKQGGYSIRCIKK